MALRSTRTAFYTRTLQTCAVAAEPEAARDAERALPATGRPAGAAAAEPVERPARAAAGAHLRSSAAAATGADAAGRRVGARARAQASRRVGYAVRHTPGLFGLLWTVH